MELSQRYTEYKLFRNDPTLGDLLDITGQRRTNDGQQASLPAVAVQGEPVAAHYSPSWSVTAEVKDLIAAADATEQSLLSVIHCDLPTGITLNVGRLAAWAADALVDVDAFAGPFPAQDWDTAGAINSYTPFAIAHDTLTAQVGIIRAQLAKLTVGQTVAAESYVKDRGNAKRIIFQLMIPYTLGDISGLAPEYTDEGQGRYETRLMIRPKGSALPFFQIGCFENDITKSFDVELAESMKGYYEEITSRSIKRALCTFEGTIKSFNEKALAMVTNMIISKNAYGGIDLKKSESAMLPEWECLLQEISPKGLYRVTRLSEMTFEYPDSETSGGDDGYTLPIKAKGHTMAEVRTFPGLYQTIRWIVGAEVTA